MSGRSSMSSAYSDLFCELVSCHFLSNIDLDLGHIGTIVAWVRAIQTG